MKRFVLLFLLVALVGCSNADQPSDEKIKQFYSDSDFVVGFLYRAFSERRALTSDEEKEMTTYDVYYGYDSDFYNGTDDMDIKMIVTRVSMMNDHLTAESTTVGGYNPDEEFLNDYEAARKLLDEKTE